MIPVILAEISTNSLSATEVGAFFIVLTFVVILAERVKALFFPNKPIDQEYVRKAEFSEFKREYEARYARIPDKSELQSLTTDVNILQRSHKELSDTTAASFKDITSKLADVRVEMQVMHKDISKELSIDRDKIIDRMDNAIKQQFDVIQKALNKGQ